MRRMVVIPEDEYKSLMAAAATSADPYIQQINKNNSQIADILSNPKMPNDTKTKLYDQKIRRNKRLAQTQPEAQIEAAINLQPENAPPPSPPIQTARERSPNVTTGREQSPIATTNREQTSPHASPAGSISGFSEATASTQADSSRSSSPPGKHGYQGDVMRITQYLMKNHRAKIHVHHDGRVLNLNNEPIRNSRLSHIVRYILEGTVGGVRAPNGYHNVMNAVLKDPELRALLKLPPAQEGGSLFKHFRPKLWKQF